MDAISETLRTASFAKSLCAAGGDAGKLIAEFDWSATSVGPIETWSQSLRTMVGYLLRAPVPLVMLWGEDGVMLYNDAYSGFAGGRHPALLGSKVREGWPEVADFNDNVMKVGLAGGTLAYSNQELTLYRNGAPEQVWMNLDYSPVPDETGRPAGVMAIVIETTDKVLAERREGAERLRQQENLRQMPGFIGILSGPDYVYEYVNDAYIRISERGTDFVGRRFRDVFPELVGQGYFELLDEVYSTGRGKVSRGMELRLHGGELIQYIDFVFEPIRDEDGHVTGIFIGGYEVTDSKRAEQRREALLQLHDILRDATDPAIIAFETARILGETLDVSRVGYGTVDPQNDTLRVQRDWTAAGVDSLAGELNLRDYGTFVEDLKAGRIIVISDVDKDARTKGAADALRHRHAAAFVNIPVMEQDETVAVLYINSAKARNWSEEDLSLIREVAERTRMATERVRAADAQRRSEAALRELNADLERQVIERSAVGGQYWQVTPDLIGVCNTQGHFEKSNPAWRRTLGWSADEIAAIPLFDFVHPDDKERTLTGFAQLAGGQPVAGFENRYRHKDGHYVWLSWVAVPIADIFFASGRDITAEKQQAEALAKATAERNMLANIIETTDAFVQLLDKDFNWLAVNRAMADEFERVFEVRPQVGDNMLEALAHLPDHQAQVKAMWDRALGGEEFRAIEEFGDPGHYRRAYEIKFNTLHDADGKDIGAYQFVYDVSERVQAEARLAEAEEQLRQAQKMEAVGQLTGGIAHDFNNMLAVIMGSLDLLNRRVGPEDQRSKRYIEAAMDGSKRSSSLVQRLLAFSRQQPLRPETLDPNKLVVGMSDLLRHSIGADIRLENVLAGGVWRVEADPNQLESVILNLAVNARDAMPDGGRLTIETQNTHLDPRYVAAEIGVPAGQYVMIAITDTGTGMAPNVIAKAFDPFFTTKAVGKGSGLGLSQVYGFVKQSGGHVRIYSELGQGTTIKIYLPRSAELAPSTDLDDSSADLPMGDEKEIILVVDDEPAVRQFSVDAFTELGYRVLEAGNAAKAMEILKETPDISLLFTDIVMPDVNGRKLADDAQALRPGLKVLYTTGYTRNAVVHNGTVDKGVDLIGKPFTIDDLAEQVRDILDR